MRFHEMFLGNEHEMWSKQHIGKVSSIPSAFPTQQETRDSREVVIMAVFDIGWATIAANESIGWFIHGFNSSQSVVFSIVVFPGTGVPFPKGHATLTQGESFEHVDGTKAYKIYIRNNAPFNSCNVHVLAQVESF
jgi:hypothetical protein